MWFANSCGSLAISETNTASYGWSWNVYAASAESNALFECSRSALDCRTVVSVCTN
jgi:hypothetical protein